METTSEADEFTTAAGLLTLAWSYLLCAENLQLQGCTGDFEPPYLEPIEFLAAQSMELMLKSYLRHKGLPVQGIRKKFGHRINELRSEASKRQLRWRPRSKTGTHFDELARRHGRDFPTRYTSTNAKKNGTTPNAIEILTDLRRLFVEVEKAVVGRRVKKSGSQVLRHPRPNWPGRPMRMTLRQAAALMPNEVLRVGRSKSNSSNTEGIDQ